jgi:predicted anti-sigma-YlaC factor YlaD
MTCEDVLTRRWEYLDEELAPEEARAVVAHLGGCPECRGAYRCDRAFLLSIGRLRWVRVPAALATAVRFHVSSSSSSHLPL